MDDVYLKIVNTIKKLICNISIMFELLEFI